MCRAPMRRCSAGSTGRRCTRKRSTGAPITLCKPTSITIAPGLTATSASWSTGKRSLREEPMLGELIQGLRENRGIAHKRDIDAVAQVLRRTQLPAADPILIGDDCAAIPDGDHYLLFAIEGFLPEFVETDPWFAGYCAVMVNASDIYAMGGRPIALVDAVWSNSFAGADAVLQGLTTAARLYGIP